MNKAFEEILEQLEKYKYSHLVERDSEQLMHCKEVGDCSMSDCSLCVFDKAIKIVQQVVEEYNNGWIPCSERLPTAEEYQLGNGRFLVTDGIRTYEAEFDIYESHTFCKSRMASNWFVTDNCVTHWQNEPLPEPYHLKEETEV